MISDYDDYDDYVDDAEESDLAQDELDLNNQSSNWEKVDTQTLEEWSDEDDEPEVTLPEGYDDDKFNMRGVQSEGDEVDEYLRNYVDAKHSTGSLS